MPKKAQPLIAVAPITALVAPPPPSPIVQRLRQDWRWAAISQFIWTFSDAFGLLDWDIENLEADLDGDETQLLPDLLAKLLFALTYNRQINRFNAFENLTKQYLKRAPESTILGTLEEPKEWATLGLSQKVQILWELCEWQLNDPARFRALLKSEEDSASWRIDPIGWDKAGNTYFLFDDNRLWVQHQPPAPPRPPKKSSLKAKRAERALKRSRPSSSKPKPPTKKTPSSKPPPTPPPKQEVEEVVSGPRKRTQVAFYGNVTPTIQALKRGGPSTTPQSTRGTRSSARRNGDAGPSTPSISTPSKSRSTPLPLGTRVSRRLREVEDEWQQVPDEWLGKDRSGDKTRGKRQKDDDDESDLSELTDEEEHERRMRTSQGKTSSPPAIEESAAKEEEESDDQLTPPPEEQIADEAEDEKPEVQEEPDETPVVEEEKPDEMEVDGNEPDELEEDEETDDVKFAAKQATKLPEGFVEWEAVCVTLYDWRTFPEQFAKSRDPDEKALYKMLTQEVGPTIIEVLVGKEQEKIKQAAVMNRKRSSRIATKELEREEILRQEKAQREMEERMETQRREETRKDREEAEAAAREKAREDRLKEREERAAAREQAIQQKLIDEEEAKENAIREREARKRRRELGLDDDTDSNAGSGVGTPQQNATSNGSTGDRWELACEVCRKQGWNVDEDLDLVCCDDCARWQHTECHDRQDTAEGRPKRNWDKVDFKCKDCRRRAARKRQRLESDPSQAAHRLPPPPQARQILNGSASGPSPPRNHSRPPAPPLQQGQYYLPYPPGGQAAPPAGYAVYYPPNGHGGPPRHSQSPSGHGQSPIRPSPPQVSAHNRLPIPSPGSQPGPPPHQSPPRPHQAPQHNMVHGTVPHSNAHPFGPDPRRQVAVAPGHPYMNGHGPAPPNGYSSTHPGQQIPHRPPPPMPLHSAHGQPYPVQQSLPPRAPPPHSHQPIYPPHTQSPSSDHQPRASPQVPPPHLSRPQYAQAPPQQHGRSPHQAFPPSQQVLPPFQNHSHLPPRPQGLPPLQHAVQPVHEQSK